MSLLTDVCNEVRSDACVFFPPRDVVHLKRCALCSKYVTQPREAWCFQMGQHVPCPCRK